MTDTPLLCVRNLTLDIAVCGGMLDAVRGIDFDLDRGEPLCIVGESGSGKSLTSLALMGLLGKKIARRADRIKFDGTDLLKAGPRRMRRLRGERMSMIFQEPYSSLNPRKSIFDIVSLPLRVHRVGDTTSQEKAVREILDIVGLPARVMNSFPSQMSGGQRQRVAIARALIMKPEIVICDEPTSALDVSVQSQILNLLGELRREFGLTYLFISHNLAVVEHLATRVAVMYLGRIVEEAGVAGLFDHARHPYTRALLQSVLTPEPGLGVPDTHLGAAYPNPIAPPSGCHFHPRCAQAMPQCSRIAPRPILAAEGRIECHLYDAAKTTA